MEWGDKDAGRGGRCQTWMCQTHFLPCDRNERLLPSSLGFCWQHLPLPAA